MICSRIDSVSYYLPEKVLTNEELASLYPGWTSDKIFTKTGINQRHISENKETAGDLGEKAARKLFKEHSIDPSSIDFIILGTQSPDYALPTTACTLQNRLGLPNSAGALDFNLGCSAFIYGMVLAKGLISCGAAKNILLITAETYSKYIHPMDKSVRTIFGDGAAATLIQTSEKNDIEQFILGTDGSGYDKLIVKTGGMRQAKSDETAKEFCDDSGNIRTLDSLFMDGTEIFSFTINIVPPLVKDTLIKNNLELEDVDLFIFHQANQFMLEFLRKRCEISKDKFYMNFSDCGNTVSSSIPIALARANQDGTLKKGMKVMLVGFGVGLSWGACVINW